MTSIGFIGIGHMGRPMAEHLLNAGYSLYVYDVVREATEALAAKGAQVAGSPQEMVKKVDVLFTMVQTGQQVKALCLGEAGVFQQARPGLLYIDCSSIDISTTRELHQEAQQHQIDMLDAPVSGGVAGADAGALTFMVGGEAAVFQRAEPLLTVMGKKVIHAGLAGHGQAAKICNNMLLGISMIGVCEAFALAGKLGLDAQKFFDISANASGQCWSMTSYCPVPGMVEKAPSNHGYQPGFMAKMMLKDLRLAQHAAETVNANVPLGAEATQLYELYVNQGHGEEDFSGMMKFISQTNSE